MTEYVRTSACPYISVIMPTFNSAEFVSTTIESVLSQSFSDFEFLIVDDASTDQTYRVLSRHAQLDGRIKLHRLARNSGGPAAPRNYAVSSALGDYVAFIDADDIWHPRKLELQLQTARSTAARFICADKRNFVGSPPVIQVPDEPSIAWLTLATMRRRHNIVNSSVLCERALLDGLQFNESPETVAIEDYLMWIHIHERIGRSCMIRAPLVYYRLSEAGISRSKLTMAVKILRVSAKPKNYGLSHSAWVGVSDFIYYAIYKGLMSAADRIAGGLPGYR